MNTFLKTPMGLLILFIFALAVLSIHLAADAIIQTFEWLFHKMHWWHPLIYISFGVFFLIMIFVTYWLKNRFFPPYAKAMSNKKADQKKHLILFLSVLRGNITQSNGIPSGLALTHDLDADIHAIHTLKEDTNKPWAWEMPLRALLHHMETLETLTLVCSKESYSQSQVHWFLDIFNRYKTQFQSLQKVSLLVKKGGRDSIVDMPPRKEANNVKDLLKGCDGYDFEDFNELSHAMLYLIKELKNLRYKDTPVNEYDIMIDITGGQVPTSVVGASITFNRPIEAQYVSTNTLEVLSYDVVLNRPEGLEH